MGIWNIAWPDGLAIIGFALTVMGLGFNIWQVRQTLNTARATEKSVRKTLGRLARDDVLSLVGQLQRTDRDLHTAVSEEQTSVVVADRLADWRDFGFALWQLIQKEHDVAPDLLDDLLESAKMSANVRGGLPTDLDEVRKATKKIRQQTSRVCGQLASLEKQFRYDLNTDDGA